MTDQNHGQSGLFVALSIAAVGLLGFGGFFMFHTTQAIFQGIKDPVTLIEKLPGNETKKDENGCSHILLMGGGGKDYDDGSELVDSIMVASVCNGPDQVIFTSIPRDLVIKVDKFGYRKINTLYILAKHQLGEAHSADLMLEAVTNITGLPVQYYAYVDFNGFINIFDALSGPNGLDVNVNPGFVDREFPGANYSYITVRFEEGMQKMDGKKALQYVRSRHGVNLTTGEGVASDFDRSRRQQEIIARLKDRIKDVLLGSDMTPLVDTANALQKSYETNIPVRDMLDLAARWKKVDKDHVYEVVLKEGPGELLYVPTLEVRQSLIGGAWFLLPIGGDFTAIQKYVARVLENPVRALKGTVPIEVLNGTKVVGLAGQISEKFLQEGITILSQYGIRNTYNKKQYPKTLLIDNSGGGNLELLKDAQRVLGKGEIVAENPEPKMYSSVGITVILGADILTADDKAIEPANVDIENYNKTPQ